MPDCHQCGIDAAAYSRSGDCSVCFKKGVDFCQRCAMWELGPLDATVDMVAQLTVANADVDGARSDTTTDIVNTTAEPPLECDNFLSIKMCQICSMVADQEANGRLYGGGFKPYVCRVLKNFNEELYKSCKFDRAAIQVLLVMHLSAQERVQCRDVGDKSGESTRADREYTKRWQTRELATRHLERHLDDIEHKLGSRVRNLVERPAWRLALGLDDIEFLLKGFKPPTLFAIDLLAAAGSPAVAQEAFQIAVILYHSLVTTRSEGELEGHWSQRTTGFHPAEALGFFSKTHRKAITSGGPDFTAKTRGLINRVFQVLDDTRVENALPSHPRYPSTLAPGLTPVETRYLQYLPTMDNPEPQAAERTECERTVRARVERSIEEYRDDWLAETYALAPTLTVGELQHGVVSGSTDSTKVYRVVAGHTNEFVDIEFTKSGFHVSTTLNTAHQDALDTFVAKITAPALLRGVREISLGIVGESGNDRRAKRHTAISDRLSTAWQTLQPRVAAHHPDLADDGTRRGWEVASYVDGLIEAMWRDFRIDQAFDMGVVDLMVSYAAEARAFTPQPFFPLKSKGHLVRDLFPGCGFTNEEFLTVKLHYVETTGSSARLAHYMDWRNHKDHWLYDCFTIEERRRPLFASLSLQPNIPERNKNYGGSFLLFHRDRVNGRVVFNFGDKQQPRRSMLLLIDDLLFTREKKDRTAGQTPGQRQRIVDSLIRRYERVLVDRAKDPQPTLEEQWADSIQGTFARYPDGDLLIEAQIFGRIDCRTDTYALGTAYDGDGKLDDTRPEADLAVETAILAAVYPSLTLLTYTLAQVDPRYNLEREQLDRESPARRTLLDQRADANT